jgi:tetratricopeptide (TPR) repeat protein
MLCVSLAHLRRGVSLRNMGEYVKAKEAIMEALTYAVKTNSIPPQQDAQVELGNTLLALYLSKEDEDEGDIDLLKETTGSHLASIALAEALNDPKRISDAMYNLGCLYNETGDQERAIECFVKAVRDDMDDISKGRCYFGMGMAYKDLGRLEDAVNCFSLDMNICGKHKDVAGERDAAAQLGWAYLRRLDTKHAVSSFKHYQTIALTLKEDSLNQKAAKEAILVCKQVSEILEKLNVIEKNINTNKITSSMHDLLLQGLHLLDTLDGLDVPDASRLERFSKKLIALYEGERREKDAVDIYEQLCLALYHQQKFKECVTVAIACIPSLEKFNKMLACAR